MRIPIHCFCFIAVLCLGATALADVETVMIHSVEWLVDAADEIRVVSFGKSNQRNDPGFQTDHVLKTRMADKDSPLNVKRPWTISAGEQGLLFLRIETVAGGAKKLAVLNVINLSSPLRHPESAAVTKKGRVLEIKKHILEAVRQRIELKRAAPKRTSVVSCDFWDPDPHGYFIICDVIVPDDSD